MSRSELLVGLARSLPALVALLELALVRLGVEAVVQQALVGELVDDARVQHQVAHRPARQAEQAQQPVLHFGALGEERQVALAAQQRLDPVDEEDGGRRRAAPVARPPATAREMRRPRRTLLSSRSSLIFGCAQSGRTRAASSAGSWARKSSASTGSGAGPQVRQPLWRRRAAVVQELVELDGDAFARGAEQVEKLRRAVLAGVAEAGRDPVEIAVVGRQDVGLLVVEVLDAMLDAAQQRVGIAQARAGGALHQAAGDELVDRLQRRAGADLGKLAAAHDQQQLDDELDLADAAARQLDVVGALGPPGGAPLRLVAHLDVELAQALEDAVVEVAPVDEGGDQRPAAPARGRWRRSRAARRRGSSARRSAPTRGRAPAGSPRASPGWSPAARSCRSVAAPGRRGRRSRPR